MFVRAKVEQGIDSKGLLVPVSGIAHNAQGGTTALVVNAASQIEQRTVQTRSLWQGNWVVTSGLKEGDRVVVAGGQKVQPNMKVAVTEVQAPASPAAPATAADNTNGKQAGVPPLAQVSASQTK
jgi:membrane fusion protein (multidrug efflux system)